MTAVLLVEYDVEAWLLPYWNVICNRLGVHRTRPRNHPEQVNNLTPPSKQLEKRYRLAKRKYKKPLEMTAILEKQDLGVAARECQELRLFLNNFSNSEILRSSDETDCAFATLLETGTDGAFSGLEVPKMPLRIK